VLFLALLVGAGVTAAWLHLQSSVPDRRGRHVLPGLTDTVRVRFDSLGVPHLSAATELDAHRALGWIHASERLWQMETFRRIARGRLAEIFGEEALESDRFLRALDPWEAAGRSLRALDSGTRATLEAYARGVNARLRSWEGAWPPEFVLLGIEPEPWTPRASVAVGKVMALNLSAWRRELSRFWAHRHLPPEKARAVASGYPAWGPTILGSLYGGRPARADSGPDEASAGGRALARGGRLAGPPGPFRFLPPLGFSGSNAWAVAARRTEGGAPLLANDMHLALQAPSTWYLAALHVEEGPRVAGLTIPGAPTVIVGHTPGVAWSFTNGMTDDVDFVLERVDAEGATYRDGEGWRRFATRVETLRVRGGDPVVERIRETVRGPVLSDVLSGPGATLSARWVAAGPTTELVGLLEMNRARGAREFDAALRRLDSPQQNVLYAAAGDTIGYRLSGSVPRRAGFDGRLPVPAGTFGEGWEGFWAPDSLPWAIFPPSGPPLHGPPAGRGTATGSRGDVATGRSRAEGAGWLAGANNLQAWPFFGVLGVDYPIPFRARRIQERLSVERSWTPAKMHALQHDVHSLLGERLRGRAVEVARRVGADTASRILAAWDLAVDRRSRGAPLLYAWVYRLRSLIAADEYESRNARDWGLFPIGTLLQLLEEREGREDPASRAWARAWVDDVTTPGVETLPELEERAMRDAVEATAGRSWGELHRERSAHFLGRSEWLDRIFGFDVGPTPSPGAPRTVRTDDYRRWLALDTLSWRPPWSGDYGPTVHFVAEVREDGVRGAYLLPTGQSGHPFDPHYRDMAARWRAGGPLVRVPLDPDSAALRSVSLLELVPVGELSRGGERPSREARGGRVEGAPPASSRETRLR